MASLPRLFQEENDRQELDLEFLRRALSEPLPAGRDLLSVTVRAPSESLEKFLRLLPGEPGFLWSSAKGTRLAGAGEGVTLQAQGENRLPLLRSQAAAFWERLHGRSADPSAPPAVLFGGISFVPGVAPLAPWEEFDSDSFSMPRWTYRRVASNAFLTLLVNDEERRSTALVNDLVTEARRILASLETESVTSLIQHVDIPRSAVHHVSAGSWNIYLESVLDAIRSGRFQKIVAARRCVVDLSRPIEDTGFMARLFASYPDCNHFAVRKKRSTFLGASPETLFVKRGLELTTHALAGTTRVSDEPGSDPSLESAALKRSQKDLAEHALVVKRICDELWPLSKRIRFSSSPHARHVRNLVHLQTPVSAELRPETHVFDLLAALHPTPAVGGFPAREAADWIRLNEPFERGWYTGALGWLDAAGDAEIAVAIRCGVLTEKRAHIFAGAGIVERSNPESEYAETAAKMQPILRALGVTL